ncbi:MAG TPA: phosphatase PAP2 family protein [Chloroflexota bacterium]|jgi:undecaprenyl-diphosphatase
MAQYERLRRWFIAGVRPAQPLPVWFPGLGIVALLALIVLTIGVFTGVTLPADDALELGLHVHDSATLTSLMQGLTVLGYIPVMAAVVVLADILLVAVARRLEALLLTGAMLGEGAWDDILKFTFRRPRPLLWTHVNPHSWSFPSGHAFATLCLLLVLLALIWRHLPGLLRVVVSVLIILLAFGIGISRVYLGVHYPSDVAGGWLAGLAWLGGVAYWSQRTLPPPAKD